VRQRFLSSTSFDQEVYLDMNRDKILRESTKRGSLWRLGIGVLAGLLIVGVFVFAPVQPARRTGGIRSGRSEMLQPVRVSRFDSHLLPFSFEQVTSYFDEVFEKPGFRVGRNIRLYSVGNGPDEFSVIGVSATAGKIAVTLLTNGDWGVNYIREFFEAPFFRRSESEQLYALLDGNRGKRSANLGRFYVELGVFESHERLVITAEFEPVGTARAPLAL
jgi:hypothetical protein